MLNYSQRPFSLCQHEFRSAKGGNYKIVTVTAETSFLYERKNDTKCVTLPLETVMGEGDKHKGVDKAEKKTKWRNADFWSG